ncbi:hypothetical protein BJ875DRAFT_521199 [Amylocarpus encephaloides]|uniref:Uncharacterized protein n=1 Tax=Amylocarpus encephaloides TaxID=45428 RepID=A0A9P8C2C3_9HELO|nr:hypothetical protein BJ875DRAFT_521199 [Amylocarpus encephaloides]
MTGSLIETAQVTTSDRFSYTTTAISNPRYTSTTFIGIMIDTGASRRSTVGYGQFRALQKLTPELELDKSIEGQVSVQFGIGITSSIGSIKVTSPIGTIQFHVVQADTPFLLCLADMDKLQVYLNNVKNVLVSGIMELPVARRFGHPVLLWRHLAEYCHYCQKHGGSPGRFRFTPKDDLETNYCSMPFKAPAFDLKQLSQFGNTQYLG